MTEEKNKKKRTLGELIESMGGRIVYDKGRIGGWRWAKR